MNNENSNRIYKLDLIYYDFEQGSDDWLKCRNKFITASMIGQILNGRNTVNYKNLIAEKASNGQYRSFNGNNATKWGHKYEPVANMLFEYKNPGILVYEYGLIHNPKYPNLGVSPDGITSSNEMLEIKCPISRKIDGTIKKEYFHQIQQQLLVCEIDICNFLECKMVEVDVQKFWLIFEQSQKEKGIIIQSSEQNVRYNYYSPIELSFNQNHLEKWYQYRLEDITQLGGQLIKTTYWILDVYHCQKVKRDLNWYALNKVEIDKFWATVEQTRLSGDWKQFIGRNKSSETKTTCLIP